MIMYGAYKSDTSKDLIDMVHRMHNSSTWKEKTFSGKFNQLVELYMHQEGVHHYTIN